MKFQPPLINLLSAWIGVLAGFVSGALIGLKFHREDWLGGYTSHRRRMLRLGHISFFGLAVINVMFHSVAGHFAAGHAEETAARRSGLSRNEAVGAPPSRRLTPSKRGNRAYFLQCKTFSES